MKENTEDSLNIEVIAPKDRLTVYLNANGGISIKQVGIIGEAVIAIKPEDIKPLIAGLRLLQKELSK